MTRFFAFLVILATALTACPALAADAPTPLPDIILGKTDAPVTVEEFVSLTCPHCADFYNNVLPELEKKYVETGKVKFILRDYPLDGTALKAAALARCMPADEFYPFIKTLYKNQATWVGGDTDNVLIGYVRLGGLDGDKAKACLNDDKMQDAVIAERTTLGAKFNIESTPTFVLNAGADTIVGVQSVATFEAAIDRLLAAKK
jgi:protein-disulfide isomerase